MALLVNVSTSPGELGRLNEGGSIFVKRVSGGTVFPHFLNLHRTYIFETRREEEERKKENKNQRAMILAWEKGRETAGDDKLATIGKNKREYSTTNNTILNFERGKEPEQKG